MAPSLEKTIYIGPFVHSKSLAELEICTKGAIGVDEKGVIAFVERDDVEGVSKKEGWESAKVVEVKDNGFFFPGFIDTHIHASQYPNAGIFGKSTLLDWLNTYTFPLESSLSALPRATTVYTRAVSRTLSHGTTTAAYYATVHVPATNLLADICLAKGQRALIGRVCMNSTLSPDYYRDASVAAAIAASRECVEYCRRIDPSGELVAPIITPRFAPSCTEECLHALGALQKETGAYAQTHISENAPEIALVNELFPTHKGYADVYDKAGLLNPKMILAHAVHLTAKEKELVAARDAKISHCPASNTALTSGCAPVRDLLDRGITVGLGTDVSGGFSPSILEMARQAIWVSRHVAMHEGDHAKLSVEEVLYLATRGGAKVVGLEEKVGAFEVGMEWDAQMVALESVPEGGERHEDGFVEGVDVFGWEAWEDRVAKWLFGGDDRCTVAVWVRGRLVHSTGRYRG
ncbi:guanine deaminase [Mytilinidion resinicola]|uniref:Guanine deaminase n=1 Tax=Mytilinidion resinicola TaxID=574789 RepID=A0A6A6YYC0_9PEZI|nr:guanine deaminase [Mytilinidion resinicola]KAF2813922.1 guanine deaminase [Mytilinidion resinicola]